MDTDKILKRLRQTQERKRNKFKPASDSQLDQKTVNLIQNFLPSIWTLEKIKPDPDYPGFIYIEISIFKRLHLAANYNPDTYAYVPLRGTPQDHYVLNLLLLTKTYNINLKGLYNAKYQR